MDLPPSAVVVALLTPYERGGGGVDAGALRAHVDWLVEAGVDGLMPCGTTGEGPLLADDEVAGVVRATVAAVDGRVPVLAHVGRPGRRRRSRSRSGRSTTGQPPSPRSCRTTTPRPTTTCAATTTR